MTVEEAIKILDNSRIQADSARASAMMTKSIQLLDNYIEACSMAIEALEKQIPKKPIFVEEVYDHHEWRKDGDEIDMWALDNDYHNGPVCERCGETFCIHCYADVIDEKLNEKCDNSRYICPACGKEVYKSFTICTKCGQKIDWGD